MAAVARSGRVSRRFIAFLVAGMLGSLLPATAVAETYIPIPLDGTTATPISTGTPGEVNRSYGFECVAGSRYALKYTADVKHVSVIRNSTGRVLAKASGGSSAGWVEFVAAASGPCIFNFDPVRDLTGNMSIVGWVVAAGADPVTPITPGGTASLSADQPVLRPAATFDCAAGTRYLAKLESTVRNSSYVANDSTKKPNGFKRGWNESTPKVSATCRIVFDPYRDLTGVATARLWSFDPANDERTTVTTDGVAKTLTVMSPLQQSIATFTCTAGKKYAARVTATVKRVTRFLRPDGKTAKSFGNSYSEWVSKSSGTCSFVFDPVNDVTGELSVQIWETPA